MKLPFGWQWQGWTLGWKKIEGKITWNRPINPKYRQTIPSKYANPVPTTQSLQKCEPELSPILRNEWERAQRAAAFGDEDTKP